MISLQLSCTITKHTLGRSMFKDGSFDPFNKKMSELDKFIKIKTNSINTVGITDPIDEDYLKEICEEYYKLKVENISSNTLLISDKLNTIEYKSLDFYEIKETRKVFVVENDKDRDINNSDLLGREVIIDGHKYKVKGIESFALQKINKGQKIGLLV